MNDRRSDSGRLLGLTGWIGTCFAAAIVGMLFSKPAVRDWYPTLVKPLGNPPAWVFGPVWTCLYLIMAVAAWRVWRITGLAHRAIVCFAVQLTLNVIWSGLFFGLHNPLAALIDVVALWIAIAATLRAFWQIDRAAGVLLIPYLAWVTFATYLNAAIVVLNR
ncbi:MAG TPA: TspO/MBR family protein [Pirellulales bacterium]|nr:TspO/MBR family protein [Pirellulales bacterium]